MIRNSVGQTREHVLTMNTALPGQNPAISADALSVVLADASGRNFTDPHLVAPASMAGWQDKHCLTRLLKAIERVSIRRYNAQRVRGIMQAFAERAVISQTLRA